MHQLVVEQLRRQDSLQLQRDEVYAVLTDVICHQLGVRPEHVVPDAHFVHDLDADW